MKLTQEQIAKLIYEAYRAGRSEGMEVGHKDGYENGLRDGNAEGHDRGYGEGWSAGWERGYEDCEQDIRDAGGETGLESGSNEEGDEEDEYEEMSAKEVYAAGWNDGYHGKNLDLTMKEDKVYLWGYTYGEEQKRVLEEEDEETGLESATEEDDTECNCSQCTSPEEYDMGWSDGYTEAEIDPDLKDNEAYMDGYLQGRDDRENNVEEA